MSNLSIGASGQPLPTNDDAFVVSIGNRPKLRTDGISSIIGLLEKRYELSEAVIRTPLQCAVSGRV